jgi:hypothetical protein
LTTGYVKCLEHAKFPQPPSRRTRSMRRTRNLGPREPGPREPGPREPGPREPGPREPGPREPGTWN